MAEHSTQSSLLLLPMELRDQILRELFSPLPITVHNDSTTRCQAQKLNRTSTLSIMRQVNRQLKHETTTDNFFLRDTTAVLARECWDYVSCALIDKIKNFRHVELTGFGGHTHLRGSGYADDFADFFKSCLDRGVKFHTITCNRSFATKPQEGLIEREKLEPFVLRGIQSAQTLVFQVRPDDSYSPARACKVSITEGGSITITGSFVKDVENVAALLCRMFGFDSEVTCVLKKMFGRTPAVKTLTVGEIRGL